MPEPLQNNTGPCEIRRTTYNFPLGIPAFEHVTRFSLVENPLFAPLVVLESETVPPLRFACAPVGFLMPDYQLELSGDESVLLGPIEPSRLLVLAILTFSEAAPPTANLLAPVVLNPASGIGLQSVQANLLYSHIHPLREASPCS